MLNRRSLISRGVLAAAGLWLSPGALAQTVAKPAGFIAYPFALGVAAGDPADDGFVIWTRLAPRPLDPDHGLAPQGYSVRYEVSESRDFAKPVLQGEAIAWPELGHSVHVTLRGLRPDRVYFYRFLAGGERSPIGRARTMPAAGADVAAVRLGVAGCQHYEHGYYTAFRHLGREDCHAIFHYGDYIYEYNQGVSMTDRATGEPVQVVRRHVGPECFSLDEYRLRYAQERMDVDLQFAHASAAWLSSYDDHELANNWVGDLPEDDTPPQVFHLRRLAAMQAWYEYMPVRDDLFPRDGRADAWRAYRWGRLLDARMLNTRAYRSDQPCNDRFGTICDGVRGAKAEVLGSVQEDWLVKGLAGGGARWNALLQQIMMMDLKRNDAGGINTDSWAGYLAPRDRLLSRLRQARVGNLVVLTGDEHQSFAGEVRPSNAPDGPASAIEFVTTSATSGGDGPGERRDHKGMLARNPSLKFLNDERGYALMTVTPDAWEASFRVVDTIARPGGQVSTRATWRVPAGSSSLERA